MQRPIEADRVGFPSAFHSKRLGVIGQQERVRLAIVLALALPVRMTRFLQMAVLGFGLIGSAEVQAKCTCQCINGWMQSVCSSPGDTVPAVCPMTACSMTGPTVLPVQPPQLPRPGTSGCSQQQGRIVCR